MIIITTTTSNANAPIRIHEGTGTSYGTLYPRVSRSGTLDGGAVIAHLGYSEGDRTIIVAAHDMSVADRETLRDLVKSETLFILSCREGCFLGAIESYRYDQDPVRIVFLVKSSETE
jgi:hypothetical protein